MVADRYRKRTVLLATQSLFTVPSFALFALSATGHAQYWMVLVAAAVTGTINLFDVPARQSFLIEMVGRQDLMNAIALNSSVFNGAAVIGPSIAGVIIAAVGVPLCFLANSVSYLAAVGALLLMRSLPAVVPEHHQQPWLERVAQGAAYARREPAVGMMLVAVAVFSLFAMNRLTLIPLFADQVLHVGAQGFGFLMGSMGLGALAGALTLAFTPGLGGDPRRQFWMALIWVAALLVFSASRVYALSLVRHRQQSHPDSHARSPARPGHGALRAGLDRGRANRELAGRRAGHGPGSTRGNGDRGRRRGHRDRSHPALEAGSLRAGLALWRREPRLEARAIPRERAAVSPEHYGHHGREGEGAGQHHRKRRSAESDSDKAPDRGADGRYDHRHHPGQCHRAVKHRAQGGCTRR